MGSALCTLFKKTPVKIMFYGLDSVGKTTLLYRLKLGEVVNTIPTIGFNVESVDISGTPAIMWDVGLRSKARPLVRHYTADVDAIVFMVDSSDRERLSEAVDDFLHYVYDDIRGKQIPVLVLANKQDKSEVMSPEEIKEAILKRGGDSLRVNAPLEVFPTVALTLDGVNPALEWMTSQLAVKIAQNSYFPSASGLLSRISHYPASFVKSAYTGVVGLWSSSKDIEPGENKEIEPGENKDIEPGENKDIEPGEKNEKERAATLSGESVAGT